MSKKQYLWRILLIGTIIIVSIRGYTATNINTILISLLLVWLISTIFIFLNKIYILSIFNFVMFVFLMGNIFAYLVNGKYELFSTDIDIIRHVYNSLVVTILTVMFVAILNRKSLSLSRSKKVFNYNVSSVRLFSLIGFLVTVIFSYIEVFQKVIFVSQNGYVNYYLEYTADIPYVFLILSSLSSTFFYIYLGTFPNKRKLILPTLLYLGIGVLSLFFGQRNHIILRIIIVIVYYILRIRLNGYQIKLKIKYILIFVLAFPLLVTFLNFWGTYRFDLEYNYENIIDSNLDFLSSIGSSVNIIEYGITYKDSLNDNVKYSLGEIEIFLRNNTLSRLIGIKAIPNEPNTIETALSGRSFSSSLMYYQNRTGYLSGYGIGSSYIAEVFNDFSYIGIFLATFIYSWLLVTIFKIKNMGYLKIAIALSFSYYIFYAFRSTTLSFLTNTFSIPKVLIYLLFAFIGKYIKTGEEIIKYD